MIRRSFLALVFCMAALCGCRRSKKSFHHARAWATEPTLIDPEARVARRIEQAMQGDGAGFVDPMTLLMLASLLVSILRYCAERKAAAIHQRVARDPEGATAIRLRGKLRRHLQEADIKLFPDSAGTEKHIDATMTALASATAAEFRELVTDVQAQPDSGIVNMRAAAAADEWSKIE